MPGEIPGHLMDTKVLKYGYSFKALLCAATLTASAPAFAQIWVSNTTFPGDAWSVASSEDGTKLVAGGWPSVYTSTNSGATWTSNNLPAYWWTALASSADGTHLVTSSGHGGPLYTSTNSGTTWTSNSLPIDYWFGVGSSADGTRLVAVVDYGYIYTSTNSGTTWTSNSSTFGFWMSAGSSADGNTLVAMAQYGRICTSSNAGLTWALTIIPGAALYGGVASSADGTRLVAAAYGAPIYTSTNSGATWNPTASAAKGWMCASSSADGKCLVAGTGGAAGPGPIYISTNSGATWGPTDAPNGDWWSVASSADGSRLAAVAPGTVYTWQPAPVLSTTLANGALVLSWVSTALPFVLQQNPKLVTSNWEVVTNVQVTANGRCAVAVSPFASRNFYRLRSP